MSYSFENQVTALAGVFQAAKLVQEIAWSGHCDVAAQSACFQSLFATNPESVAAVFGGLEDLQTGFQALAELLSDQSNARDRDLLRYVMNMIYLESRLRKNHEMLAKIGQRIDQSRNALEHFGLGHRNLAHNLAGIYMDSISHFKLRIQVTGNPAILKEEDNAARIRALLLAGIRSAVLWRQTGGRRWHLVFKRGLLVKTARALAKQNINESFH